MLSPHIASKTNGRVFRHKVAFIGLQAEEDRQVKEKSR